LAEPFDGHYLCVYHLSCDLKSTMRAQPSITNFSSWGGLSSRDVAALRPANQTELELPQTPWLAYGNGRSYGDSCFPSEGTLIDMRGLNRILSFDTGTGVIRVEAGVILGDLITAVADHDWFPAVVPGTRFVTIGGALCNDVHGKNHHRQGTFGEHVLAFELLRSDGSRNICSAAQNAELYHATIGGMGLTGVITWIELQLMKVASPDVMQEAIALESLDDFFNLAPASDESHDYSVAWIDSLARGKQLGRGVLLRANHADHQTRIQQRPKALFSVPFMPPISLINTISLTLFNKAYRWNALAKKGETPVGYRSFFFPLDAVNHWNRIYGPGGLRQHQSILPMAVAKNNVRALIEETHKAGHGSFLTVLKLFADRPQAGMMSFPRHGVTLTLDFPYRGKKTDILLDQLDRITIQAGGRVNPYKDAHMSAETFAASYPETTKFKDFMDPMARSRFSQRTGLISLL
jgi:FAD/FMN-containing dehydrogenase